MEVVFYQKEDGTSPAKDFVMNLPPKMKAKVLRVLELLERDGYKLREPHSKELSNGIMELRAKQGSDISRVLYFFIVGNTAVLTNGFVKKSQKTPKNEIALAEKCRTDFLSRTQKE